MLFLGQTGVGKTELAKALADIEFGSTKNLIRFDMSEFMEKHTVSKLIGSPPGYVGYEEEGLLIKQVRSSPYSVVLFDEIEKAHSDVLNILLQILEDGIVTGSDGRSCNFKNTIVIMTGNIGADEYNKAAVGFGERALSSSVKSNVLKALKKTFRAELINRIDEVVVFNKLEDKQMYSICDIMLSELTERAKALGISLQFSDELVAHICKLASSGSEQDMGARSLRRIITRQIEDLLSDKIVDNTLFKGGKALVDIADGDIVVKILTEESGENKELVQIGV